ncbi:type I 3-dehydroquinate dehydratase [Dermatophilus congolensis]|uniref:type I 3-dehydroquinate dehydratase n=1 Tax=Dermatophilus congolensis TaxID=1863 RepID=UPI001AAE5E5A|nr:type I 3-dehydroquinate dehydratase [Dermatophilus congolensis]MBO3143964.1 type I 3-dehydroquinate dehydratase [Dermatophilus congolensis]MBO3152954.1 type I 3-dehydroquinate dehydratase [Dermatophilus congolensis]MBO3160034.1 type I 3-dehydroquinate dehydratase [Dermatophilus congolensis]MBO3164242.1 type I 3-dehydroquinate dehydratase [Dermatophilus congolensis]MBO3177786.1 type I 3-dehydroquinate dehydratase [Dermatophilus congolensis]
MDTTPLPTIRAAGAIGAGRTTIITPLIGSDIDTLREEITRAAATETDMLEWRADQFRHAHSVKAYADTLGQLTEHIASTGRNLPCCFTYRTMREGGNGSATETDYLHLIETIAGAGADFIDIEYRHPVGPTAIHVAQAEGALVIASAHDFTATPEVSAMVSLLADMENAGADIAKLAVTATTSLDLAHLFTATSLRHQKAQIPLITIAMGSLGAASRLVGAAFGSAATFARVAASSAPGQLAVDDVVTVLHLLERAAPTRDDNDDSTEH